jgi:hypothetical protein
LVCVKRQNRCRDARLVHLHGYCRDYPRGGFVYFQHMESMSLGSEWNCAVMHTVTVQCRASRLTVITLAVKVDSTTIVLCVQ